MKQVIATERLPIKMWLDDIEDGALQQAKNLANLPFAYHHIAIMPDCHQGYGCPIGAAVATKDVIVPSIVGVDIGCAVSVYRTDLDAGKTSSEDIEQLIRLISKEIPFGMGNYPEPDMELVRYLEGLEKEISCPTFIS